MHCYWKHIKHWDRAMQEDLQAAMPYGEMQELMDDFVPLLGQMGVTDALELYNNPPWKEKLNNPAFESQILKITPPGGTPRIFGGGAYEPDDPDFNHDSYDADMYELICGESAPAVPPKSGGALMVWGATLLVGITVAMVLLPKGKR